MTNFQESDIKVSWDEATKCIINEGIGFNRDEKIKAKLNSVLALLKEKKATRLLIDMRQVAPFGKEIQTWIEEDWVPRMIAAGLKTQAFVTPNSLITRMIMDKSAQKPPRPGLETAYFESPEAAKEWLNSR